MRASFNFAATEREQEKCDDCKSCPGTESEHDFDPSFHLLANSVVMQQCVYAVPSHRSTNWWIMKTPGAVFCSTVCPGVGCGSSEPRD
jgi:hypothetical protein